MNQNAITHPHEPTEAEIQHTAYLLWLESGKAPNRDVENWLAAKELLRHRGPAHGRNRRPATVIPPAIPTAAE